MKLKKERNFMVLEATPRPSMDIVRHGFRISGTLVHEDGVPLHHFLVRVRAILDWAIDSLREVYTDADGKFFVVFPKVEERVKVEAIFKRVGEDKEVVAYSEEKILTGNESTELGKLKVNFYEYQKKLPLLEMPKKYVPEENTIPYMLALVAGGGKYQVITTLLGNTNLSLDHIQKLFGENLTMHAEAKKPGITHEGAWIGERLLKGFNPCHLQKTRHRRVYKVDINWNKYEFDNQYQLPNAKAYFKLKEGKLTAKKIYLQFRKLVPGAKVLPPVDEKTKKEALTDWKKFKAKDPDFSQAIRSFLTAYLAEGEVAEHLGAGHLNTEQYAVAAFRHLRNNPVKNILFPHLRNAIIINNEGAKIIFGPTGALTVTTALTADGVEKRLSDKLGSMDWHDYAPRAPISSEHQFAEIANLYWHALKKWVRTFVKENQVEIERNWIEIKRMSDDLVRHSIPYQPLHNKDSKVWVDLSEIDASNESRLTIDGVLKSVRPITMTSVPQERDWERLIQVCTYAIYHATFWHSWVHNKQTEDAGDWRYGVLGLRGTGIGSVDDPTLFPKGEDLITQLKLAYLLPAVMYGYITKNEYGDIDPRFVQIVNDLKNDFQKHGINLDEFLRSCVNI